MSIVSPWPNRKTASADKLRERVRQYGITVTDYHDMQTVTDGACWICREPERIESRSLAIDHDHTTGQVRGLLCTRCNQVLGRMQDDPALLRRAADYLEEARRWYADDCQDCLRPLGWEEILSLNELPGQATPPSSVVASDGSWTQFRYECAAGHRWTCGWATRGLPEW